MSNSFEHFEKRFFSLLGRLRRHKGWMSETTQLASEINPIGKSVIHGMDERSEINPTERVGKTLLILPAAAMGCANYEHSE
ncbi:MAG: hypothetical protein IKT80_04875 [Bacteroidaceae bacterium]|nr:hypothetical protein [Bacteroidaceae bacterium]